MVDRSCLADRGGARHLPPKVVGHGMPDFLKPPLKNWASAPLPPSCRHSFSFANLRLWLLVSHREKLVDATGNRIFRLFSSRL
jgi:hypothetical protein